MKKVLITSLKGGTGKSFFAYHIARELSKSSKVCAIDCDFDSSNLGEMFGCDICFEGIEPKLYSYSNNLDIFSIFGIEKSAISMSAVDYREYLRDLVDLKKLQGYDYLVIDTPAGASDLFKLCTDHFKARVAVVIGISSAFHDIKKMIDILEAKGILVCCVVLNMVKIKCKRCGTENSLFDSDCEEIEQYLSEKNIKTLKANFGAYNDQVKRICKIIIATKEPPEKRISVLKKSIAKVLVHAMLHLNKFYNFKEFKNEGLGGKIIKLSIYDGDKESLKAFFRIEEDGIKVLKSVSYIDAYIQIPISSLINVAEKNTTIKKEFLLGNIKYRGGESGRRAFKFMKAFSESLEHEIRKTL